MHDQANQLRELVRRRLRPQAADSAPPPRLLLVCGGKGGVGTTTVAVSLAIALGRQGRRAVLVDADPRGGDAAALCGLAERYTLADVLAGRRTAAECLEPGPGGIGLLAGAWGLALARESPAGEQQRLIDQLWQLHHEADFVVLDGGNGCDRFLGRFWQAADAILLVTTPEPVAVMDAYAAIKLFAADGATSDVHVLVNKAPGPAGAREVQARLAHACFRLLGLSVKDAGYLCVDERVGRAGGLAPPLVLAAPRRLFCTQVERVARLLAGEVVDSG